MWRRPQRRPLRSAQFSASVRAAQPIFAALSILLAAAGLTTSSARAQAPSLTTRASVQYPTSDVSDRVRLAQLAGDTSQIDGYLLRSPSQSVFASSLESKAHSGLTHRWLAAQIYTVTNTAVPFSLNDGALWAGRGVSARVTGGLVATSGRFRAVVAPELWIASNARFDFNRDRTKFFTPAPPEARYGDGFANPWYVQPYSADVPWRYGSSGIGRLVPGQSGVWYDSGPIAFGATTENMWWGPGIQNAIVMSDNAAGVPRLELKTSRPWRTRAGNFEARWFVGALSESQYFDTTSDNDVRSLAAAAVTWRPAFQPSLTLGVTRAVYATASGYGAVPFRWLDVFANTGHPADRAASDSSLYPGGRDQLLSLFGRWIFPSDGFEVYTEWARQELPKSLHDFIISPSQSHGYTLGLQYRKPAPVSIATFRLQAEITTLEQSPTFKNRPVGVFYTSRRVIQGYTQLGQPIGAAIGPGASSQWLALDRVGPRGAVGVTLNRIRWNEDVRSTYNYPGYVGYCNHDVSIMPGVRAGRTLAGGYLSGEVVAGTRYNEFFQNQSGCPTGGPSKVDVHNTSVSLSFTPFAL